MIFLQQANKQKIFCSSAEFGSRIWDNIAHDLLSVSTIQFEYEFSRRNLTRGREKRNNNNTLTQTSDDPKVITPK